MSNYRLTYDVDIVLCMDVTMASKRYLEILRKNAMNFYQDLMDLAVEKKKRVTSVRVRVIAFRDYYYDREMAMMVTDFFDLPAQSKDFENCIKSLYEDGGGDDPEDGLEALALAIKSDWKQASPKKRDIIVMFSDDGTHDLGFGKEAPNYPEGMPKDFRELSSWWGSRKHPGIMNELAKRLLMFTPNKGSWDLIRDNWNNVIHYEIDECDIGLHKLDYEQIIRAISSSI